MADEKNLKIVFDPGCFDSFEGTQEELDEFVAELKKIIEDGSFLEKSTAVDMDELDADEQEEIERIIQRNSNPRTLN
jgi:hypothetical protein